MYIHYNNKASVKNKWMILVSGLQIFGNGDFLCKWNTRTERKETDSQTINH